MAFLETPRLESCFSMGVSGGPEFSTAIAILDSGFEFANQNWAQARRNFTISYDAKRPEVFASLLDYFMAVGGMANQFRVKDPFDYSATSTQGVVSQLTPTTFQMYKRYSKGAFAHNRKIQKPYGTITVIGGSTPVVNMATGVITVSSGTPTGWYGDFDVPCRFKTDVLAAVVVNRSNAHGLIITWSDIEIIEVRIA